MRIVYEFCKTAQDQNVLNQSLSFFWEVEQVMHIELLCYYPEEKQFMTHHEGFPTVRYWDMDKFNWLAV